MKFDFHRACLLVLTHYEVANTDWGSKRFAGVGQSKSKPAGQLSKREHLNVAAVYRVNLGEIAYCLTEDCSRDFFVHCGRCCLSSAYQC